MSDEERDTSIDDAVGTETIEDEPLESDADMPYEDPSDDDDTSPLDDAEESQTYAGKYSSIDELEKAYGEAQKKISQQDDYATLGRHVAPSWDQFQRWQDDQQGSEEYQPDPAWNPPHDIGSVQRAIDLMGTEGWEGLGPQERGNAQEYLNYYNQKWRQWQTNPNQFADDMVHPVVEQMVSERFADLEAQLHAASFWREHSDELKDHVSDFQSLLQSGVPTDAAREIIQLRKIAAQSKNVRTEKDELQRKKDRLKGRVSGRSQRGGGSVKDTGSSPDGKSFSEIFDDAADAVGATFGEEGVMGPSS